MSDQKFAIFSYFPSIAFPICIEIQRLSSLEFFFLNSDEIIKKEPLGCNRHRSIVAGNTQDKE